MIESRMRSNRLKTPPLLLEKMLLSLAEGSEEPVSNKLKALDSDYNPGLVVHSQATVHRKISHVGSQSRQVDRPSTSGKKGKSVAPTPDHGPPRIEENKHSATMVNEAVDASCSALGTEEAI